VRRAINHAINKAPIVQIGYQGLAIPAEGPLPPDQWGHHDAPTTYAYDPEGARQLLRDAAAAGVELSPPDPEGFTLYAPSTPRPYASDPPQIARALAANLEAVGLPVKVVLNPYQEHRAAVQNGQHDLALFGWVSDNGDPDNFLYVLLDRDNAAPGQAGNIAFYSDPTVHQLLVDAQGAASRAEREQLYAEAQDRIAADAPWVPLAHSQVVYAARRDLANVMMTPTGHVMFSKVRRD